MTRRPSRLCSCGKIVPARTRCACQIAQDRARNARHDRRRPNSSQRGYNRQWEEAARAYLAEPGNDRCARCGAPATVVMHRISIRRRPDLRMVRSNWRPGCHRCNAIEAAEERR